MSSPPPYNLPHPPSLYVPGLLQGEPVRVQVETIQPLVGDIHVASLVSGCKAARLVEQRNGEEGKVAAKVTSVDGTRAPRNVKREARLLGKLTVHPNIIALLNAYLTPSSPTLLSSARLSFFLPLYPFSLRTLLDSPTLLPCSPSFLPNAHSLAYQLLSAVSFLHTNGIAHRDICPNNVVLSRTGRAVLIDFGIAVEEGDEKEGEMHFEVGTGSYRAPELLFGPRTYSPPALDLWALGATLSEFFTPLAPRTPSAPSSTTSSEERFRRGRVGTPEPPWGAAEELSEGKEQQEGGNEEELERRTLFQGGASDFLLAGSIFRVLGTPTAESWPESAHLPSFHRFAFSPFPPSPLLSPLPNLDPSSPLLQVLEGLLKISAGERMNAEEAMRILRERLGEELLLTSAVVAWETEQGRLSEQRKSRDEQTREDGKERSFERLFATLLPSI
ncbi:hypothetical protein JCM8547_004153 [Rhodosporidiobolus lusitaniae]